jgi:hypothetical protein
MTTEEYLRARGWRMSQHDWWYPPETLDFGGCRYNIIDAESLQLDRDRDVLQYVLERRAVKIAGLSEIFDGPIGLPTGEFIIGKASP